MNTNQLTSMMQARLMCLLWNIKVQNIIKNANWQLPDVLLKKNTFNPDLALGDTIQKSTLSRTIKNIYIKHFTYKKKRNINKAYTHCLWYLHVRNVSQNPGKKYAFLNLILKQPYRNTTYCAFTVCVASILGYFIAECV